LRVRAVIVDDEELGRKGLRVCLERLGDVEVVAECRTGRDAISAIVQTSPDVVFVDVEMPGKSGLDVIEAVGAKTRPQFVLVTAHDRYAVRAFEANVLDYLLKPISDDRLKRALDRVRESLALQKESGLGRRLAELLQEAPPPEGRPPDRFVVRSGGRVVFVRASEIDWVEAQGDYVGLHVGKKSFLLRETLGGLERSLNGALFARIHRSTIVNVDRIAELKPFDNGEYVVVLLDGTELKLSRSYRDPLQRLVAGRL
jgi:two-component system LytT family response regulator